MATFRADRVQMIFTSQTGNSFRIHGLAPGTFVTLEMDGDFNELEKGEDGEAAWRQNLGALAGKGTFQVMQASSSNADISAQMALDELDGTGAGTMQVLDGNGATLGEGPGRFAKQANAGFGGGFVPREWMFRFETLKLRHTGITQR